MRTVKNDWGHSDEGQKSFDITMDEPQTGNVQKEAPTISPQDDWDSYASKPTKGYKRCWETHPPLPITVDGKTYEVRGGSCHYAPKIEETDIFVGFDHTMDSSDMALPWVKNKVAFKFEIIDMQPPKDVEKFKRLISYLAAEIKRGKRVYMGCIGGHGRTGTVMAALVKHMTGEEDAISYVRKHYCKKTVESQSQVDWLHQHFGIKKVPASKGGGSSYGGSNWPKGYTPRGEGIKKYKEITCIASTASIFGKGVKVKQK